MLRPTATEKASLFIIKEQKEQGLDPNYSGSEEDGRLKEMRLDLGEGNRVVEEGRDAGHRSVVTTHPHP